MIKSIAIGSALFLGLNVTAGLIGLQPAAACNRIAGCAMDNLWENYAMMHSNKMTDAMAAGKDNIEAFRRLQEAERGVNASAGAPKR